MKNTYKKEVDDLANKIIDLHAEIETIREEVEKRRDKLPKSFLYEDEYYEAEEMIETLDKAADGVWNGIEYLMKICI